MVQIKMETEDGDNYDDGPCSPAAFMLEPEPDDDMEFEDSKVFEAKTEIEEIATETEPRVPQKKKLKAKIRINTPIQFICKFCGQAFKYKLNLVTHEKYIHSSGPRRNYKLHCSKKFEFQSRLDGHIRHAHTAERLFACHVSSCNQKFAIKTSLTQHLKSHGIFPSKFHRVPRSNKDDPSPNPASKSKSNGREESNSESNEIQETEQASNYSGNGNAIPNFNFPASFPIQIY